MREIKTNECSRRKACYSSPSVRVIDVKMNHAILTVSTPTDMTPTDVF